MLTKNDLNGLPIFGVLIVALIGHLSACGTEGKSPMCRLFASHYTAVTQATNLTNGMSSTVTETARVAFDRATLTMTYERYPGDASATAPALQSTATEIWDSLEHALASGRPVGKNTYVRSVTTPAVIDPTKDCTVTFDRTYDSMGRLIMTVGSPYVVGCPEAFGTVYDAWDASGRPTHGIDSLSMCPQRPEGISYDDKALMVTTTYDESDFCPSSTHVANYDSDGLIIASSSASATSMSSATYTTLETSKICP